MASASNKVGKGAQLTPAVPEESFWLHFHPSVRFFPKLHQDYGGQRPSDLATGAALEVGMGVDRLTLEISILGAGLDEA